MSTTGFIILAIGGFICFTAFVGAAINMGRGMRNPSEGTFKGHIAAMVVMAIGGLIAFGGILKIAYDVLGTFGS